VDSPVPIAGFPVRDSRATRGCYGEVSRSPGVSARSPSRPARGFRVCGRLRRSVFSCFAEPGERFTLWGHQPHYARLRSKTPPPRPASATLPVVLTWAPGTAYTSRVSTNYASWRRN